MSFNFSFQASQEQLGIKQAQETKNPYKGPYPVTVVKGAKVTIDEEKVTDVYNIKNIKPYYS